MLISGKNYIFIQEPSNILEWEILIFRVYKQQMYMKTKSQKFKSQSTVGWIILDFHR